MTAFAIVLGVWISARTLGLLNRPRHWLRSTYLPPRDLLGFFAMPHFLIEYENRGNVPVVFSNFTLGLPRLEGVIWDDGTYVLHPGAELFIDKRPTSTVGGMQHWRAMDYRTNKVRLEPGEIHTDFFDLGAFLPGFEEGTSLSTNVTVPSDFSPVLIFQDSFGNQYFCDAVTGIHRGRYEYPYAAELKAAAKSVGLPHGVLTQRRAIRWFGWRESKTSGLGE